MSIASHSEIVELLRAHCRGKQTALAAEAKVSSAYVSNVFAGKQPAGPRLLRLIGAKRVLAYEVAR